MEREVEEWRGFWKGGGYYDWRGKREKGYKRDEESIGGEWRREGKRREKDPRLKAWIYQVTNPSTGFMYTRITQERSSVFIRIGLYGYARMSCVVDDRFPRISLLESRFVLGIRRRV